MSYLFETHLHTKENDVVIKDDTEDIIRMYREAGYDGIVITNHYFDLFFEWFPEIAGKPHRQIIDRWLFGYRKAKEIGEKYRMVVLLGAELRLRGPECNDYLLYGADEDFFYNAPLLNEFTNLKDLSAILPGEAVLVQAHPFRTGMVVKEPKHLFGIEVYNGQCTKWQNDMAEIFAKYYGLPMTSGSDCHCAANVGKGGLYFNSEVKTPADFASALKSGNYYLRRG